MKKILSLMLVIVCIFTLVGCNGLFSNKGKNSKEKEFCDLVVATQELLDTVGGAYYDNWHECIYDDRFLGDIDYALLVAEEANKENIETIRMNTEKIEALYKECKNSPLKDELKEVIHAYNAYYSFVIEISGSFESYSQGLETYKKDLSNSIKNLSVELD